MQSSRQENISTTATTKGFAVWILNKIVHGTQRIISALSIHM